MHVLGLALALASAQPLVWPTGVAKHGFYDTPLGQLHYVHKQGPLPLVYFHGHPRSTVEFKYVAQELGRPFVAIDYFGQGMSEDLGGTEAFCSFDTYAQYVWDLLASLEVDEFVAVGHLKGTNAAISLAALATPQARPKPWTQRLALFNPLFLTPQGKQYLATVLIPELERVRLLQNGSHVTQAWLDPSAAPMRAKDGQPVLAGDPRDVQANTEKTIDDLRQFFTGAQSQKAWVENTDKCAPRVAAFDHYGQTLFLMGTSEFADMKRYMLDPEKTLAALDAAFTHHHNTSTWVDTAGQGMMVQNASYIAGALRSWLGAGVQVV